MKIALTLLLAASPCLAAGPEAVFSELSRAEGFRNARWSVSVRYADTGKAVFERDAEANLVPGSTMKVFITAAALDAFGPEHRFRTRLLADGKLENGFLNGDIVLEGGGDPALASEATPGALPREALFEGWLNALKAAGVSAVNGSVRAESGLFQGPPFDGSWAWEDIGNYYAAQPSGLTFGDNLYKLYFRPGPRAGDPAVVLRTEPFVPGLEFDNFMLTGPEGSGDNGYVFAFPDQYRAVLRGTVPKGPAEFAIKGAMPQPGLAAARAFNEFLRARSFGVFKPPYESRERRDLSGLRALAETYSPPLKEIVNVTNKRSFNLYAELLLRHLGLKRKGEGTLEAGLAALKEYVGGLGVDVSEFRAADACGLSRLDLVKASTLSSFLAAASKKVFFPDYRTSLVEPGENGATGHIRKFGVANGLAKSLRIKSGSLAGVRSYAGYLKAKSGRTLAFAFIINNYTAPGSAMDPAHEKLLSALAEKY